MYMNVRSASKSTPKKRRKLTYHSSSFDNNETVAKNTDDVNDNNKSTQSTCRVVYSVTFADVTRDCDVQFFVELQNSQTFRHVFDHLSKKATFMHYWKGVSNTFKDLSSPRDLKNSHLRSLTLEQELLLTMIRLRLALLSDDLAHRFKISISLVSYVFTTWLKLISLELKWLIHWPDRHLIRRNLTSVFCKYYPNCCIIIDCSEIFIETPNSRNIAATCWSNYKHHSTVKYLVGTTPNGAIAYLSDCYGGKATDIFKVQNSDFLKNLLPRDQVMTDRGFKIKDFLSFYPCTLAIPPSKHNNLQMLSKDVQLTSRIANARIYVEQVIGRIKNFRFLKNELPISLLPHTDDIVIACAVMTNFSPPLCCD